MKRKQVPFTVKLVIDDKAETNPAKRDAIRKVMDNYGVMSLESFLSRPNTKKHESLIVTDDPTIYRVIEHPTL